MKIRAILLSSSAAIALLTLSQVPLAHAQDDTRKSPLADAPAVRRRLELRTGRFELGAGVGASLAQDFYNAVLVNVRAAFHLSDWLAVAGVVGFNVTPDFKSALTDRLEDTLPKTEAEKMMRAESARTPVLQEALDGMNKVSTMFALQGELTPFSGKYSLFGKWFANYDFYGFGGVGGLNLTADGDACGANRMAYQSCPVTGLKVGPTFGVGTHTFVRDWVAIHVELRDILIRNNPAGRDVNGDKLADDNDLSWNHNFFVTLNATFFFPKAKISD